MEHVQPFSNFRSWWRQTGIVLCWDLTVSLLSGNLMAAGSFYSDLPQVETVGVTLQYDMGAPLHSPIWLDGYQFFQVTSLRMWLLVGR